MTIMEQYEAAEAELAKARAKRDELGRELDEVQSRWDQQSAICGELGKKAMKLFLDSRGVA